jgi:hypothetical protein
MQAEDMLFPMTWKKLSILFLCCLLNIFLSLDRIVAADRKLTQWGCGKKLGLVMPRAPGSHDTQQD